MAIVETTTLRVPVELRDEIAGLARTRGATMVDVVTDAVRRLKRDEWWDSVHDALDEMDPSQIAEYRSETERLDAAALSDLDVR
jgi:hypothetical protein